MVEVVLLMDRHGHFQDDEDRQCVDALLARADKGRFAPSQKAAAVPLLAAAESPDAGRSDALAEALGSMCGADPMVPALLGLAALLESKRRARLHGMGMALLAAPAQGPLNG